MCLYPSYNFHRYILISAPVIPYLASCHTLLVCLSSVFSHDFLFIMRGKPPILIMLYKTTGSGPSQLLCVFLSAISLLHSMFSITRELKCFLKAWCSFMPLCFCSHNSVFLNTPLITAHGFSFTWWTPTQLSIFNSCKFLSNNNDYYTNYTTYPLPWTKKKRQLRRWYMNIRTLTPRVYKDINVFFSLWMCKF